jgi:hypothetical protein
MWKIIGMGIMFMASLVGGAIVGAIVGAIYAPVKIYAWITGKDSSDKSSYIDDEI